MKKITIYTTPVCPYCIRTKELLKAEGLEYTEVDVVENPEVRDEMIKKTGHMTVPIIMFDDELVGGYGDLARLHTEDKLVEMLQLKI
ncbi:MAG: glutaredoxin [Candidatus Magasanikbacteria bacterium CG_4_10_14_0_2_um_filter_37_12]|uniref:Glutaredoxin n=1 Tax=Candidatus Magasanikbacteria bacterium CG_4_10_14_0_2_um_filter_37_12 TaxID=1974637 RepID=A0A2M7V9T5_9BACT|nr:MAG: glutaredoxin [Candidatus Magasanikbacteria bacterium CG_4_10_14_0_2_um_filter_37_12]